MDGFLIVVAGIVGFSLIKGAIEQRSKERMERLRVLEEALKNPAVDRDAITALAQQLTGQKPQPKARQPGRMLALVLALGWLTLFSGLGVWIVGEMTGDRYTSASGVLVSLIGFGLVTYPFALRELESRRQA